MPSHDRLLKQRNHVRSVASDDMSRLHTSMQMVTGANRDDARKLLSRLQACETELSTLDQQILANVDDSLFDAELGGIYEHRTSLTDAIASLDGKLRDFAAILSSAQPSTSAQRITSDQLNERIPEMELTEFDGNPIDFEEFWDDFITSVDQRSDISTITKLKLLRKSLVGNAAAACKGYKLTIANYVQVKSILEERYGDKETAIALHLDALIRLNPASSCAVSELIRVRDDCEVHIRALVILGFGGDAFGQIFAPIVLSKLPDSVRLEIRRQKKSSGDAKWTMTRLRELLSTEIQLRASNECEFFGSRSEHQLTSGTTDTARLVSSSGSSNSITCTVTCAFCRGHHYSSNCNVYLDVASRQAHMGNRCFRCLRSGHWKGDCRKDPKPCYYCKKRDHHCSLCLHKFGSPSKLASAAVETTSASSSYAEPRSFRPETICTANSKPSTSSAASINGATIVETAIATVTGTTGSCKARLILDCGSTKSFVSSQLARRIGARLVGYDSHAIGRFGDDARVSKQLARYEFSMILRDGSQRVVQMNAEEQLTPSVTLQPLDLNAIQQQCKASDLAEVLVQKSTEAEIDMLVGLDYYYVLVGQHSVRTVDGLVLKDSRLGMLTTGYIQPAMKQHRVNCATSAFDITVSRERPAATLGNTSSAYQKHANQPTKIQEPDSYTSTLRSLTSSLNRQTIV